VVLQAGAISRFVAVDDTDYDPIREMARLADTVQFS
jgi:ABC-type phosphate/phosphonate transport system substrate-binding protein